ncbi:MAG: peptidoglycan-binding protein, partial [Clostridia bacterium]|nr:peptidoglycan-binding protein [Clostridia bacterium]
MKKILSLVIVLVMALSCCAAAFADSFVYNLGDRTLSRGMTGPDVLELQQLLQNYAYYNGTLDGSYGAGTYRAVREFQSRNNIVVTGIADVQTASRLLSGNVEYALVDTALTYVLSSGMTGEGVKELQRQLRQTYYYTGKITGTYDSSVTTAV